MVKRVPVPTFFGSLPDHYGGEDDDNLDLIEVPTPARKREKPVQKAPTPAPPVIPPTRLQLGKVVSRK